MAVESDWVKLDGDTHANAVTARFQVMFCSRVKPWAGRRMRWPRQSRSFHCGMSN